MRDNEMTQEEINDLLERPQPTCASMLDTPMYDALCPDICGTCQQRATEAVAEAQKARKQMDELHACLKEAMEWCKPCNYEHETWLRWAKARDSHKPNTALSGGEAVHSNGGVGTLNQKGGE